MIKNIINYLFPDETIKLDKINKEINYIYIEARTNFEKWQSLIKEIHEPVDKYMKTSNYYTTYCPDEKSILLNIVQIVSELDNLSFDYIMKINNYINKINSPISLNEKYKYLEQMKQFAQEKGTEIKIRIDNEGKKFKNLLENVNK